MPVAGAIDTMTSRYSVWIGSALLLITFGVAVLISTPNDVATYVGLLLLLLGALNLIGHRRFGSQIFRWSTKNAVAGELKFWHRVGEPAVQQLYWIIGMTITVTGLLLVIKGL